MSTLTRPVVGGVPSGPLGGFLARLKTLAPWHKGTDGLTRRARAKDAAAYKAAYARMRADKPKLRRLASDLTPGKIKLGS